jgi:hypothetical protein
MKTNELFIDGFRNGVIIAGLIYVLLFYAYLLTLALSPDAVAGPHAWEWAGATCPDPEGHHLRGPFWTWGKHEYQQ